MKKKLLALSLTACLIFALAGCGSSGGSSSAAAGGNDTTAAQSEAAKDTTAAAADTTAAAQEPAADAQKLLYIHGAADSSILQTAAEYFKGLIEERTNGRYTIEIHPNFELGSLTESVQMIKSGDVQLSGVVLGSYYSDDLAIVDLPNAVPTIEDAYKLYTETDFRAYIEDAMRAENIELLDFGVSYFREMTSNKEVHSADDIKGINIRTLENNLHTEYWSALGANPSPLAWADTYIGLQQGLVDAEENPLDSIYGGKLYEVQKYVINTNHIVYTAPIMMNEDFFQSLSPEDQEIFRACGKETEEYVYNYSRDYEATLAQQLKDEGMEFIDLDESVLAELKSRASSVYDTVREQVGDETMDKFLAAIDSVTAK